MDCNPFHGTPIDTMVRRGNDGPGKGTTEFGDAFTTIPVTPSITRR